MDDPVPPREDDPLLPGDGEEPARARGGNPLFTRVTIAVAVIAVLVAALLGAFARGIGIKEAPKSPIPSPVTEPIGTRIEFNELLRLIGPHLELYRKGLPPFDLMHQTARENQAPDLNLTDLPLSHLMSAPVPRVEAINQTYRQSKPYSVVGKLSSVIGCTATLVDKNIIITASHCLPWNQPNQIWQDIRFTPALDSLNTARPDPYKSAGVTHCVGINPPVKDGRDIAVCKLDSIIGDGTNFVVLKSPRPTLSDTEHEAWYRSNSNWISIGYPFNFQSGTSQGLAKFRFDTFAIDRATKRSLLQTAFFADEGWSGGPALRYDPVDKWILGATVRGCLAPPGESGCARAILTDFAAGIRMEALVTYGIVKWAPDEGWGFSDWGTRPTP